MKDFKEKCKKANNKNFTFVKIRTIRHCSHCLKTMVPGTECLTVNPRRGNRRWYCEDCVQAVLNVEKAKSFYDNIAFGDEGGAQAALEWISEAESVLENRRY